LLQTEAIITTLLTARVENRDELTRHISYEGSVSVGLDVSADRIADAIRRTLKTAELEMSTPR
jgi:hypothetical protein